MNRKTEKYMLMVLGSLVGASLALLLAPQSGRRTRHQIVRYGRKVGNRTQRFVGEIAEAMDEILGDIVEVGQQGLDRGKELTERAREEILEALDAGKKYIEQERVKLDKVLK
jgi:gas vesicle protein